MESVIFFSAILAICFTIAILRIWNWFEYQAFILPAKKDVALAFVNLGVAMLKASYALGELSATIKMSRINIKQGGIVSDKIQKEGNEFIAPKQLRHGKHD